jgi:[FeFe] hydrogenase H-cluster maturation GTPase HydF
MKGKESKPHIGIFGRRNKGKSSLINKFAGQDIAIVSPVPGTTTDPVKKSIEISDIGPVVLIDTAGIDDTGDLGEKRKMKTFQMIPSIDLAILVITDNLIEEQEISIIEKFKEYDIPFFFIHNKSDIIGLQPYLKQKIETEFKTKVLEFSALKNKNTDSIVMLIREFMPESAYHKDSLTGGLLQYGDVVLLITPIDTEAPEGRLILPQVQTIRDILDNDCVAIILKEREVESFLKQTGIKPKLAITDSQLFLKADAMIPKDIPLTGFSVLLARHKGDFQNYIKGTPHLSNLKDGDRILLLESCTHHLSCEDIGRVKLPRWITNFTGKKLEFEVVAGLDALPRDIKNYSLVIQCGGCMITRKQLINRLKPAVDAGIPVTNYGLAIAYVQGIYNRAIAPFVKDMSKVNYL